MNRQVSIFLALLLTLFTSCTNNQLTNEQQEKKPEIKSPLVLRYNIDSLLLVANDTFAKPEVIITDLPKPEELNLFYSVVPGEGFLKQTVEERLEGKPKIKSTKPAITKVEQKNILKSKLGNPQVTTLMKPRLTTINNLSNFKQEAIASGEYKVKDDDTIIPPSVVHALKPKLLPALPSGYKDETVMDVSFLDSDQNLPNSYIRDIIKDDNGVLWFASHTGGLISYDQNNFLQYVITNGFNNDMLLAECLDSENRIWVATQGGGINIFDGKNVTHYTKDQGLPSNVILDIAMNSKGEIWALYHGGIFRIANDTIYNYDKDQNVNFTKTYCIYIDNKDNVWLGTTKKGAVKITSDSIKCYGNSCGLESNIVLSVYQDSENNMWFGTYLGGVSKFDGEKIISYGVDQGLGCNNIFTIGEDKNNTIWFGTYGEGVTRFNDNTFSYLTYDDGLNDSYFRSMYINDDGRVFLGSDGGGISIINPNGFKNFTKDNGLADNTVISMFEDMDRNILLGNFQHGIYILKNPFQKGTYTETTKLTTKSGLVNNVVVAITQTSNGDYLFGTYENGLSRLDKETLKKGKAKFTNYHAEQGLGSLTVRAIFVDEYDRIWLGTEAGITVINGDKVVSLSKKNGFPADNVLSIYEDKNKNLWFGTMNDGVIMLNNDTLTIYKTENGLANNSVWTITQDYLDNIWFGTDGGGLSCFTGDTIYNFSENEGLCYNYVFSLVTADSSVWAGTTRGLSEVNIFAKSKGDPISCEFVNYSKLDGLKGVDFYTNSSLFDSYGRLWFGTDKSLLLLNYEDHDTDDIPVIQIDNISINNTNYDFNNLKMQEELTSEIKYTKVNPFTMLPENLTLRYNCNHITFTFSSVSNFLPFDTKYNFKMKGLDNHWGPLTSKKVADYRNLSPGHYTFVIKAKDKQGNWSQEYSYNFRILRPWWNSWWAYIIYILLTAVLINFLFKWRIRILQQQKASLENMVFNRTRELDDALKSAEMATEAKSRFIATISHEIRTPLNAIVGLIHLSSNTELNTVQKKYMSLMDKSTKTLMGLINDILDFSKIEAGKLHIDHIPFDFDVLINSVAVLSSNSAFKKNLEFIINTQKNIPSNLIGDPLRINQIIANLCSNAIKFTNEGEVVVDFRFKPLDTNHITLEISVKDTGVGIDKEQSSFLFKVFEQADNSITRQFGGTGLGLAISKELVNMMGGKIWYKSEGIGKGSEFGISLNLEIDNNINKQEIKIPDIIATCNVLVCIPNTSVMNSVCNKLDYFNINNSGINHISDVTNMLNKNNYELIIVDNDVEKEDKEILAKITTKYKDHKFILLEKNSHNPDNTNPQITTVTKPVLENDLIHAMQSLFSITDKVNDDYLIPDFKDIKNLLIDKIVLVAEDSEINQQVIEELLNNIGIKTDIVSSGNEVVNNSNLDKYDLILMDLHMAGMDGCTASEEIRSKGKTIPIIIVTADAFSIEESGCGKDVINDFVIKPIDTEIFYSKIIKLLTGKTIAKKETDQKKDNLFKPLQEVLDIENSINRFAGNTNLFTSVLKKFTKGKSKLSAKLEKLVENNQINDAIDIIHKLKGESGNIGANSIFELCVSIQNMLENGDKQPAINKIKLLNSELNNTVSSIKKEINKLKSSDNDIDIIKYLNKLNKNLLKKSPEVFNILDKIEESNYKETIKEISELINNGKDDDAIKAIQSLINKIKK